MSGRFKLPTHTVEIQERRVREGKALHFQYRYIEHHTNGRSLTGEWKTSVTASNYGDIYDPKPTMVEKIKEYFR